MHGRTFTDNLKQNILLKGYPSFLNHHDSPALSNILFENSLAPWKTRTRNSCPHSPEHSLHIFSNESAIEFPFKEGELIEFDGSLIYHGSPPHLMTDQYQQAKWFASLYPYGLPISIETLRIKLVGLDENPITFELDWAVDNDDRLLILSDKPAPPELFPSLRIGDSSEVCLSLWIEELENSHFQDRVEVQLLLKPVGTLDDGLILSEVRKCNH